MRRTKEVDDCLRWLPEDTESLLVSSGRILSLLPWNLPEHGDINEPWTFADTLAVGLIGPIVGAASPLPNEEQQVMVRSFFQGHLRLVIGASRSVNYERKPIFDRCSLIYVDNAAAPRILAALGKHCARRHTIRKREVLEFRLADFCSSRYEFLVSPQDDLLVGASTLDTLNTLLDRMTTRAPVSGPALPDTLREWQYVDTTARAWGVRHYRKASSKTEPTSMMQFDEKTEGLVVFSEEKPRDAIVLRYLSNSPDADKSFRRMAKAGWGSGVANLLSLAYQRDAKNYTEYRIPVLPLSPKEGEETCVLTLTSMLQDGPNIFMPLFALTGEY